MFSRETSKITYPLNTGRKVNVHQTFNRRSDDILEMSSHSEFSLYVFTFLNHSLVVRILLTFLRLQFDEILEALWHDESK